MAALNSSKSPILILRNFSLGCSRCPLCYTRYMLELTISSNLSNSLSAIYLSANLISLSGKLLDSLLILLRGCSMGFNYFYDLKQFFFSMNFKIYTRYLYRFKKFSKELFLDRISIIFYTLCFYNK